MQIKGWFVAFEIQFCSSFGIILGSFSGILELPWVPKRPWGLPGAFPDVPNAFPDAPGGQKNALGCIQAAFQEPGSSSHGVSAKEKELLATARGVFIFCSEIITPMERRWWSNLEPFEDPVSVSKYTKNIIKHIILDFFCFQNPIYFGRYFGRHVGFFFGHLGAPPMKRSSWLQPGAFSFSLYRNKYADGAPMVVQCEPF